MIAYSGKNEVCPNLSFKSACDELEGILTETHLKVLPRIYLEGERKAMTKL
jgi:hypothetical protein